ncbi:hypothetical protein EDB83DRAFT_2524868 [Lactarius deliciosus]|nr:hypothetical protein EDB83DRAFT_2524868 [Lactarius deliciosus]
MDDSLSPYTSALSPSPCDSAGRGPQSALLLDLTSTNHELRDTDLSFRSRGVTKEVSDHAIRGEHILRACVFKAGQPQTWPTTSSRMSARVLAQPAVFDATALSVLTIFDSGPLLKLGAVLPAQVHSLLALFQTFQNGGLDDLYACHDMHAATTEEYDTCLRPKESAGSPTEIRVNVSTSKLAPPS